MRVSLSLAALAAMLFSLTGKAQAPAALVKVWTSPNFQTAAEAQFNKYESGLATHCATVTPDWSKAVHRVYGQPQTGADGNLVNATWVEAVPGTACGQTRRYRVMVVIRNGKASMLSEFPGESYASPLLQHDAILPVAGAVAAFQPKGQTCVPDVVDTHLSGTAPAALKQPWTETWTVVSCGKQLSVPVHFVPDEVGPGTSIHIDVKSIALLP